MSQLNIEYYKETGLCKKIILYTHKIQNKSTLVGHIYQTKPVAKIS